MLGPASVLCIVVTDTLHHPVNVVVLRCSLVCSAVIGFFGIACLLRKVIDVDLDGIVLCALSAGIEP